MKSIGKRITKSRFGFFPTHTHHKRASQLYTQLGVGAGYFLIYFIAQHPTPPLPPPKRSLAWTELQQTRAVHTHVRVPLSFLMSFFLQFFFFFFACAREIAQKYIFASIFNYRAPYQWLSPPLNVGLVSNRVVTSHCITLDDIFVVNSHRACTTAAMQFSPLLAFLLCVFAGSTGAVINKSSTQTYCTRDDSHSLYEFKTKYLNGTSVALNQYRGQVTLLVNVATF